MGGCRSPAGPAVPCRPAPRAGRPPPRPIARVTNDDPRSVYDVMAGGAGDEVTLQENELAFRRIMLRPRALADVATRALGTTVLGRRVFMPLLLGPTGYARMAHPEAELAVARAAARAGTVYGVSTITSFPLEDIVAASTGRDQRNRLGIPFRITPRHVLESARRPRWTASFVRGGVGRGEQGFGALASRPRAGRSRPTRSASSGRSGPGHWSSGACSARTRRIWS